MLSFLNIFSTKLSKMLFSTSACLVVCVESSQDHALIDLLAGLEDDGFHRTPLRPSSQSQPLSGAAPYHCNSDEEEAGPELEKEEADLSVLMSQRWDSEPPRRTNPLRPVQFLEAPPGFIRVAAVRARSKLFPGTAVSTGLEFRRQRTASVMSSRSPPMKTWSGVGITLCLPICPSHSWTGQQTTAVVRHSLYPQHSHTLVVFVLPSISLHQVFESIKSSHSECFCRHV